MNIQFAQFYQIPKTIFTSKDLAILWQETNLNNLKAKLSYYVKQGILTRVTRGMFAKNKNYDPKELAASVYTPSYISFETVLREAGIIFQYYETIFVAARWSLNKTLQNQNFTFRKLKDSVLYNPAGVNMKGNYSIATPERAFLDMLYLFPNYFFDNLRQLNWSKCETLVKIYDNKKLEARLEKCKQNYAE